MQQAPAKATLDKLPSKGRAPGQLLPEEAGLGAVRPCAQPAPAPPPAGECPTAKQPVAAAEDAAAVSIEDKGPQAPTRSQLQDHYHRAPGSRQPAAAQRSSQQATLQGGDKRLPPLSPFASAAVSPRPSADACDDEAVDGPSGDVRLERIAALVRWSTCQALVFACMSWPRETASVPPVGASPCRRHCMRGAGPPQQRAPAAAGWQHAAGTPGRVPAVDGVAAALPQSLQHLCGVRLAHGANRCPAGTPLGRKC